MTGICLDPSHAVLALSTPCTRERWTIVDDVLRERNAQDVKWGEQNHPDGTGPKRRVLRRTTVNLDLRTGAELAKIFRAKCQREFAHGSGTYLDIFLEEVFEASAESDPHALRAELIQCAAVAVAWVEKIDRELLAAGR